MNIDEAPAQHPQPDPVPVPVPKAPVRTGDVVASILLVLFAVALNLAISFAGFMLVMMSDGCNDACNVDVLGAGVLFATFAPSVVTVIGVIITIVRVTKRKLAFWVPLAAIAGQVVALVIGALVVFGSTGSF
jgi:hypothetical protein